MNIATFCSGVGMFELAASWSKLNNILSIDNDRDCCNLLRKRFTHKIYEIDINEYEPTRSEIQTIDIICAGFPCQPYSSAGQRAGEKDDRDVLPALIEKITHIKPRWVVLENVVGFATIEGGGYT